VSSQLCALAASLPGVWLGTRVILNALRLVGHPVTIPTAIPAAVSCVYRMPLFRFTICVY